MRNLWGRENHSVNLNSENVQTASWDCCVIGNGASALWAVAGLRNRGLSVLWVTSEELCTRGRATLKHGWMWAALPKTAQSLVSALGRENSGLEFSPFEAVVYDAKNQKRFRQIGDVKVDWGHHEAPELSKFFETFRAQGLVDLSWFHESLYQTFPKVDGFENGPSIIELSQEPQVILAQSSLLVEIKVGSSASTQGETAIESLVFAMNGESLTVSARHFILGDFDENFSSLIADQDLAQRLSVPWRGRIFKPGFSLSFTHKDQEQFLTPFQLIPLVANPSKKGAGAHVIGRFIKDQSQQGEMSRSTWFGYLTDEELEDNNEILKKIKSAKRVLERTIPGFADSIIQESLTFEPQMCAMDDVLKRPQKALGAWILTDAYGPEGAVHCVSHLLKELDNGSPDSKKIHSKSHLRPAERDQRRSDGATDGVGLQAP